MKTGYTKYDIDMLMNDPNTHVQIILNDSVEGVVSVEGFQTDDFDLSGSASYSTAADGDMGDVASKAFGDNKITNAFKIVLGSAPTGFVNQVEEDIKNESKASQNQANAPVNNNNSSNTTIVNNGSSGVKGSGTSVASQGADTSSSINDAGDRKSHV